MSKKIEIDRDKKSAITKYALHVAASSQQAAFNESDKDRAVRIAKWWLNHLSAPQKKALKSYIDNVFELWKLEHGKVPPLGRLLGVKPRNEDCEFEILEKRHPWDTLPLWVYDATPIGLLNHIWVTNYNKFDPEYFWDSLAWLIIFSDETNDPAFWPSMIGASLRIAELRAASAESAGKQLWRHAKAKSKQNSNLRQYSPEYALIEKERIKQLKIDIPKRANELLAQGYKKPKIAGLISKSEEFKTRVKNTQYDEFDVDSADKYLTRPMSEKNIRRYLKDFLD